MTTTKRKAAVASTHDLQRVVNVASVPQRSVFRYPGGKTWLVPLVRRWLNSQQTKPALLVEPFAGGGIVGLTAAFESRAEKVLLSELDADVAAVWQAMLGGKASALAERVNSFDMTQENVRCTLASKPRDLLDRAFATLLRNRVQHGGIMADGASLMKQGESGKGIGSRWYPQTIAMRIHAIASISQRMEFRQADGFAVIEAFRDDRDGVFFVDPPYTIAGRRLYRHSGVDHPRLFALMKSVTGNFLMTYDDTDEVRSWVRDAGFDCESVAMKSRQNSRKSELLIGRSLAWARS